MGSRVTTLLQQLSPSGPGVRCLSTCAAVQEAMCRVTLDHSVSEAGARGGMCPCMGPSLQEWAPNHVGSESLVGPHLLVPLLLLSMRGAGPEAQNIQMPKNAEGDSLHQALKSCTKSPHTKRVTSLRALQRGISLQLSIPGHSSAPSISHMSVLGLVGPHSSVSSAAVFSRQTDLVADSSADLL